ncbi:MAG: hypothetical protein OEN50_11335 [Deltaproteobacteria bacterium]|nr:hypothetical protein [Deltaproteobacteria bacterium]
MAEIKSKIALSRYKTVVIVVALIGLIGLGVLVIVKPGRSCDGIFEQTAPQLETSLELIQNKGAFAVRREKIQELSESAQKVGLHLKTCCVVLDGGKLNSGEFQQCVTRANAYEKQITFVAEQVKEAAEARVKGAENVVQEKIAKIDQAIQSATGEAEGLARQVAQVGSAAASGRSEVGKVNKGAESEPNNNALEANEVSLSGEMSGEVSDSKDSDFFKLITTKQLRDVVSVKLQNRSVSLRPYLLLYNAKKSAIGSVYDGTPGADVEISFTAEPATEYFVEVNPYDSTGKYKLISSYKYAHDNHEPNDSANKATPLSSGKTLAANIMDTNDQDWFRLSRASNAKVNVRLQNRSATLRPYVMIYDENRSAVTSKYDGTPGASLEFTFDAKPGRDYYIKVLPYDTVGPYELTVN